MISIFENYYGNLFMFLELDRDGESTVKSVVVIVVAFCWPWCCVLVC